MILALTIGRPRREPMHRSVVPFLSSASPVPSERSHCDEERSIHFGANRTLGMRAKDHRWAEGKSAWPIL